MIGARGTDTATGGPMLILGLTHENLTRLKDGKPMLLRTETHPFVPEGWTITIIAGGSDREIMSWLQTPDTEVRGYTEPS
jgi:hypothetical protein